MKVTELFEDHQALVSQLVADLLDAGETVEAEVSLFVARGKPDLRATVKLTHYDADTGEAGANFHFIDPTNGKDSHFEIVPEDDINLVLEKTEKGHLLKYRRRGSRITV